MKVEYKVRPANRYIVTRFHQGDDGSAGVETKGEYENPVVAHEVAYALCKADHDALGYPAGDERILYPDAYSDELLFQKRTLPTGRKAYQE